MILLLFGGVNISTPKPSKKRPIHVMISIPVKSITVNAKEPSVAIDRPNSGVMDAEDSIKIHLHEIINPKRKFQAAKIIRICR
ncbi:hypothetical protein HPT25_03550 [Bacillus sp. BRMEA1]|uniref:hypothetical protein n=1 Tax=Neobacillus endophyticus TaxID=2738405 RepID=UPI0015669C45|nr:hypothetical protein [Neobacillus endophyticus]NRD76565.1 hypothetical protein [Neobacillus endophyticus]